MSEYSTLAHKMIQMWNSSFSKTIKQREEAASLKINFVKTLITLIQLIEIQIKN